MANNETTTKFKVDISELKASMQEARKQVAYANSEFKATASTMDDWSKSSDGISAKLKQLNSNLKAQESVLDEYEKTLEQVKAQYGENSKEALDYATKLNNQKAVVNKIKKDIANYEDALTEVSEAEKTASKTGKDVADTLADVGKKADGASDGFTTLKGAVATFAGNAMTSLVGGIKDAIGSLIGLADETREYRTEMGKLETAFTSGGFSAEQASETYKNFYAVLGDEGQTTEAVSHLAKLADTEEDLSKWTTIATGVYGTFGDSLPIEGLTEASNETAKTGQLTGSLADALNWAGVSEDDFQASLDKCSTEQERQALITDTLNGLYSEASETYKEVNGDIMDAQRAQSELADATANLGAVAEPVMTTFKLMGASFLNELLPSVEQLGTGFSDLMNGSEGASETIGSAISGIISTALSKVTELLPDVLSIGTTLITSLIGGISETLPSVVEAILGGIQSAITALSGIAPDLISTVLQSLYFIIDAIIQNAPQLLQAGIEFFTGLVEALPSIIWDLLDYIDTLVIDICYGLLDAMPQLLESAITLFKAIVEAIPQIVELLPTYLSSIIQSVIDFVVGAIPMLIEASIQLFNAIIEAIPIIITSLVGALPTIITAIIEALLGAIPQLLQGAITLLMAIIEAIPTIIVELVKAVPEIIVSIITALVNAIPLLLSTAIELFMQLVFAIPKIIVELVKAIPQIVTAIITGLFDLVVQLGSLFGEIGSKLVEWFNGFKSTGSSGASDFVKKVIDFIKELPSKLWTWLVDTIANVIEWRDNLVSKAKETGKEFVAKVIDFIKELPEKLWDLFKSAVNKAIELRDNLITKAKEIGTNFVTNLLTFIKELPSKMWTEFVNIVAKVIQLKNDLVAKAKEIGKSFLDTLVKKIKEIPDKVKAISGDIVTGLWEGIKDKGEWLKEKISGFVGNVTSWLKGFFGIESPSKLMRDEIGKWLPEGIAVGIDKNAKSVLSSMKDLATATVGVAKDNLSGVADSLDVQGATGSAGSGGVVYNMTQINNSPKALTRLEIYRQTKNLLGYVGGGH